MIHRNGVNMLIVQLKNLEDYVQLLVKCVHVRNYLVSINVHLLLIEYEQQLQINSMTVLLSQPFAKTKNFGVLWPTVLMP